MKSLLELQASLVTYFLNGLLSLRKRDEWLRHANPKAERVSAGDGFVA